MLKFLFLICALISTLHVKAQEWFPLGASWHYNQVILFEGESYVYFEVTGETFIQGKSCKVITGDCFCGVHGFEGGYLYQEGDKIFSFDIESDSFWLLYDFNLVAGDTLIIKGDLLSGDGYFLIDSVTTIQVGSQTLRVQHITNLSFILTLGNKIIERIGSNECLYPQSGVCDPLTGGLRCYEDEETGLLNFQIPPRPCNYISVGEESLSASVIKIYPNPATSFVHIQSEKPIESVTLYNNLVTTVFQQSSIYNTELDIYVRSLPAGLYYMRIHLNDHQMVQQAFVVQK